MDKNFVGGILACAALAWLLAVTGGLMFVTIPDENTQLLNISLMALVGIVGTVFGFFFGASVSSAKKPTTDAPPLEPPKP